MEALMTRQEVADVLRVPVGTLAQWAYRGIGPKYSKVGRFARYRREDVEAWFAEQNSKSPAA